MERLKKILALEFEMKGLGSLRYFLGTKVARNIGGTFFVIFLFVS